MTATARTDNYITANGIKLHYIRQGAGEPLMLIHGWPGFWYEWHMNIDALAEHFDVIAEQAMRTNWIPRNPRKIEGPAQVREILDMAA